MLRMGTRKNRDGFVMSRSTDVDCSRIRWGCRSEIKVNGNILKYHVTSYVLLYYRSGLICQKVAAIPHTALKIVLEIQF